MQPLIGHADVGTSSAPVKKENRDAISPIRLPSKNRLHLPKGSSRFHGIAVFVGSVSLQLLVMSSLRPLQPREPAPPPPRQPSFSTPARAKISAACEACRKRKSRVSKSPAKIYTGVSDMICSVLANDRSADVAERRTSSACTRRRQQRRMHRPSRESIHMYSTRHRGMQSYTNISRHCQTGRRKMFCGGSGPELVSIPSSIRSGLVIYYYRWLLRQKRGSDTSFHTSLTCPKVSSLTIRTSIRSSMKPRLSTQVPLTKTMPKGLTVSPVTPIKARTSNLFTRQK